MAEWAIYNGDCLDVLPQLELVDAVITDPPYGLNFMGKNWDHSVPGVAFWQAVLAAMKPGAHLLAFGGTRTHHRLMVAIEDAGFEIRDVIMWVYGSGFPKSLNVSKAIDKAAGAERKKLGKVKGRGSNSGEGRYNWNNPDDTVDRTWYENTESATDAAKEWEGWGTALKPAYEPIILARKPLVGTVANNVLEYGTGALNIDESRVGTEILPEQKAGQARLGTFERENMITPEREGRWPANFIHDGSDEVVELFPEIKQPSFRKGNRRVRKGEVRVPIAGDYDRENLGYSDTGSAARFFYCPKASRKERDAGLLEEYTAGEMTDRQDGSAGLDSPRAGAGRISGGKNNHPTVKPLALMRYLCKLICSPKGVILDPFAGSGSTMVAAGMEGFDSIGIEIDEGYVDIIIGRLESGSNL